MNARTKPATSTSARSGNWRLILLLVLVVASWASATVVTKYLYNRQLITTYTLVALRFTLASLFCLAMFSLNRKRADSEVSALVAGPRAYLLGGFFISIFIICYNLSLLFITATLGGLFFFSLTPLIILVIGHYWLGTSFGPRQIIGILFAVLGVVLVISGGDLQHLLDSFRSSNLLLGLGIMVLAAFGWGTYSLWGKRYNSPNAQASLLSTGLNQMIGVAPVWALLVIFEPGGILALNPEAWLFVIYIALVPSTLGFVVYYAILKDLTLEQAATTQLFSPVFTAAMAIIWLNEPFSLALVIGTLIILAGVRISTWSRRSV